ncbi:MAG TPA: ABC transporter ATP-binding protein, partial [Halanaerobiales bacterium]|nr:ABC transporter ATP-binding protein [Halanaerobiales bacterium]
MDKWRIEGVSKVFEETTAIDNVSLEIETGKIYGLIGRNGAGKTTLLKLLANQLQTTMGVIKKGDNLLKNSDKLITQICLARETINIKGILNYNARKIFDFASRIYPEWDNQYCNQLIKEFDLDIKKKYYKLSKGMHTVIGLILGLASRAALTLFDEPYVGLDPVYRELFYELLIDDYQNNQRTMIISSHLINELENLFERVLIIEQGKLILNEELETIKDKAKLITGDKDILKDILRDKKVVHRQLS